MKKKLTLPLILLIQITISAQKKELTFNINEISTESSLNFFETEKRGIESNEGVIYYVEKGLNTVIAYEKGQIKWRTNIFESCEKPFIGKPEIRSIELKNEVIFIVYGKHEHAKIEILNGKVHCIGAD